MIQMQCNVLNIKTRKQIWLYFCGHYQESDSVCLEYNIPKKSLTKSQLKSSRTKKSTCQIFPESNISNRRKSFDHPHHLKSGVPPWVQHMSKDHQC